MEKSSKDVTLNGTTLTVTLGIKLVAENAPALTEELTKYIGQDIRKVVFDASNLNVLSSYGLRVLFYAGQRLGRNPKLVFINCAKEIHDVLERIGLARSIDFEESATSTRIIKKDALEDFAANNDVVCYAMKLGHKD